MAEGVTALLITWQVGVRTVALAKELLAALPIQCATTCPAPSQARAVLLFY